MGDDIHQIEWQNRGLQVQTANQRSLVNELQELLVSIAQNVSSTSFSTFINIHVGLTRPQYVCPKVYCKPLGTLLWILSRI